MLTRLKALDSNEFYKLWSWVIQPNGGTGCNRKHTQVNFEFYSKVSFILPAGQRNELASSRQTPWRWKVKVSLLVLGKTFYL